MSIQKGAGDFIGGMKFCPTDVSKIFVASGDGTVSVQSFEGLQSQILSRTPGCGHDHHDLWWGQCLCELLWIALQCWEIKYTLHIYIMHVYVWHFILLFCKNSCLSACSIDRLLICLRLLATFVSQKVSASWKGVITAILTWFGGVCVFVCISLPLYPV